MTDYEKPRKNMRCTLTTEEMRARMSERERLMAPGRPIVLMAEHDPSMERIHHPVSQHVGSPQMERYMRKQAASGDESAQRWLRKHGLID